MEVVGGTVSIKTRRILKEGTMAKEGTKTFNGKRYDFYAVVKTKAEAQKEASIQRRQGFFARITYAKPLWFIWLRKMYRGEY